MVRKIKYSGLSDTIEARIQSHDFVRQFRRNVPREVPDAIADILIRKRHWIETTFSLTRVLDNWQMPVKMSVQRSHGLGDLIQLIPIVRALKKAYRGLTIALLTAERWIEIAGSWDVFDGVWPSDSYHEIVPQCDINLVLDGAMDMEVTNGNEARLSRLDHYRHWLGITDMQIPYDWKVKVDKKTMTWAQRRLAERNAAKIGIQVKGSHPVKTLAREKVNFLCSSLVYDGYTVVLMGDESFHPEIEDQNIINLAGKTTPTQLQAFIQLMDAMVVMDSAPLWIAHLTSTPVIALFGPSRPQERIPMHPKYPDRATGILLNEMVGCKPCFEEPVACDRRYDCMNRVDAKKLYDRIQTILKRWLWEKEKTIQKRS